MRAQLLWLFLFGWCALSISMFIAAGIARFLNHDNNMDADEFNTRRHSRRR